MLSTMTIKFTELESNLVGAMELLENCYEAYRRASDDIRRRFNQALFVRILVDQKMVTFVPSSPNRSRRS